MSDFEPVDNNFVHKAVLKLHRKLCELDIIQTKLVKAHLDYFIDAYTKIVNLSLKTGEFYEDWRSAILRPLQKKKGIDTSNVNYRPVSNLPLLLQLVEKCTNTIQQSFKIKSFEMQNIKVPTQKVTAVSLC